MKTVRASKLSTIAMTCGGEKHISKVVDDGVLKEWVGIGWITVRNATESDRKLYPKVTR